MAFNASVERNDISNEFNLDCTLNTYNQTHFLYSKNGSYDFHDIQIRYMATWTQYIVLWRL